MREFHKADPVLMKLLGPQKRKEDCVYLRSPFVLPAELEGKRYWYSTLTKQGMELPPDLDPDGRFDSVQIASDPALTRLMEGYFLKPADRDETKLYEGIARMMRVFGAGKGYTSYVILPTMACNARCSYCYEAGSKPVTMSLETADQTVAFLLRSRRPGVQPFIQWFGGEPLLGEAVIDRILAGLREADVAYRCGFTTNGSLIDAALADKMAGLWNTRSVQITIDGTEEVYRRIKNYPNCEDAYGRVLRAVDLLARRGIPVSVRINLDGSNGGEVRGVLRDLENTVSEKQKVRVYLSPLYQIRMSEGCLSAWKEADALAPLIEAAGFATQPLIGLDTRFRVFRCMADNPAANILITPEGRLSCCQHKLEHSLCGSIAEGITDPAAKCSAAPTPVAEQCRDCVFLPDCTSFRGCPVFDRDCFQVRRSKADVQLRAMIRRKTAETDRADESREDFEEMVFRTE